MNTDSGSTRIADVDVEVGGRGVGPGAVDEVALLRRQVLQVDQRADRGEEASRGSRRSPIQPGSRPGSTRQPSEMTSIPASGKASTSQP